MGDGREIDAKLERWSKPLQWAFGLSFLLIFYVFVYPALLGALYTKTRILDNMPSAVELFLSWTVAPLEWLETVFRPFELYIDWLHTVFPP